VGEEGRGIGEAKGFGASAVGELEEELHVKFSDQLKRELDDITIKYRHIAKSVPSKLKDASSDKDLSKQIQWFEDNTIKPAQALLRALTVDRHQMRTAITPELDSWIDIERLIPVLEKLLEDADAVFCELDQQMSHRITNRDQIQFEVVSALYGAFERHLGPDFTRRGVATVDEALRIACGEILGRKEQINSVVKAVRLGASKRQLQ
jgi:predicted  nucleic acid-binding Zn-ribbon protein